MRRFRPREPVDVILNYKADDRQPRTLRVWISRTVGSGSFGAILQAEMATPTGSELVAVKRFNPGAMDEDHQFMIREFNSWSTLNHPHILPFYGDCDLGTGQIGLVSPLCKNGNMKQYIALNPAAYRLRLVRQVSDAMQYLHESARIVHGDLKCENVLISDNGTALLADFGLSTLIERTETPTATFIRMCHTACFAAPELLQDIAFNDPASTMVGLKPRSKTEHSDSFAFGRFIYEAYMGEAAWANDSLQSVVENVKAGATPPMQVNNPLCIPLSNRLWQLCIACWNTNQFQRPNAATIRGTVYMTDA